MLVLAGVAGAIHGTLYLGPILQSLEVLALDTDLRLGSWYARTKTRWQVIKTSAINLLTKNISPRGQNRRGVLKSLRICRARIVTLELQWGSGYSRSKSR